MTDNTAFPFAGWLQWWDSNNVIAHDVNHTAALMVMFGQIRDYIRAQEDTSPNPKNSWDEFWSKESY